MKKINKIFSYLLLCTIFSTLTFTSVSAMKHAIFLFDEELAASEHENTSTTEVTPKTEEPPLGRIRAARAESPLSDEELLPALQGPPPTPVTSPNLSALPEAQAEQLAMELQTVESMQEKKQEFCFQHQRILEKAGSQIDDIHKWKYSIFLYLKTLRIQSHKHPTIISDIQILKFFLDLVREFNPTPLPHFDCHDYRLRFDSRWGLYGAIICIPEDNPRHVLAVL